MIFSKGRIIGLVCTIGTLIGAMVVLRRLIQDDSLPRLERLLDLPSLLLLFALYACHFLAEPLRWLCYSRHELRVLEAFMPARAPAPDFMRIFACFNTTALLSYSLPFKLGLPLRMFLLSHFLGIENMRIVKLMAVDGVLTLLCWAAIAASLFLLVPDISAFFSQYFTVPLFQAGMLLLVAACAWIAFRKREQLLALVRVVAPAVIVLVVLTLALDVLLYGVRHMVLADALAPDVSPGAVFIIGILATFAGIMSTLPMGLGAYDATLVALLALYGVEVEVSLLLAVSNRLGMIGTSIILGVPSAFALVKSDTKIAES